ncbi:hypothetical protein DAI22_07g194400 [Oryza sativa Japonica Group]|nr:serine/arginine repetitive matrix protein 1-like [Oryza sativa Japonica Group]KAF2923477.1 hypothetical protein DAI22_07g194400 [Oryza sativa Japonica Group]
MSGAQVISLPFSSSLSPLTLFFSSLGWSSWHGGQRRLTVGWSHAAAPPHSLDSPRRHGVCLKPPHHPRQLRRATSSRSTPSSLRPASSPTPSPLAASSSSPPPPASSRSRSTTRSASPRRSAQPEPTRAASNRSGKARSRPSSSRRRSRGEGTEGARTPPPSRHVRAWQGGNGESEDAVVVTPRRGLVGRGRGERGCCRRAASGPGGEGTGRARTPPPSRTQLHRFSFPNLSWGNHRLLRCSKNPASSPPPAVPDTPSPDKEKTAHSSTDGVGVGSLPQRGPQRPWNLRTCRSATAAPCPEGLDDAADAALE